MIGVYIKYEDNVHRLDLFQDETIDITSSQQDINDISKIFTDYSQSFSIPATANNNKVFKYWYENSVQNGFDDSTKLDCIIELNGNIFRNGRLKLEKATIVNGRAKDYSVSFFGNLISLKDNFKDDKLINITEINNIINFQYTDENVVNLVSTENDSDIAFPLITGERVWSHGVNNAPSGQKSTDISTIEGSIDYKELFPAVRVSKMFEAIGQKYNINFVGNFLTDKRFTELFLYCKNADGFTFGNNVFDVDFVSVEGGTPNFEVDLSTNEIVYYGYLSDDTRVDLGFSITTENTNTEYTIYVYRDGVFVQQIDGKGNGFHYVGLESPFPNPTARYKFKFKSNGVITSSEIVLYSEGVQDPDFFPYPYNYSGTIDVNLFAGSQLPVNNLMPDIKVADFFSGILQMFNLTCYSENGIDFIIEPLNEWYANGFIVDITKFCEPNWEVNKSKQYKSLTFKYEKSESIINDKFYQVFQRQYGDLTFSPPNQDKNGEEYKVELPFENLLQQKFLDTALQVGFTLTKDLKPYTPKPIVMYKFGLISNDSSYYIQGQNKTSYNAFGQDLIIDENVYSLNWGAEQSTLIVGITENTLYKVYYENYIQQVFYLSSRQINISGTFNLNTLITLKLNDLVIIRDKRYKINKLNLNLNKQTFNLELITDLI